MSDALDLVNGALLHLGKTPILDLEKISDNDPKRVYGALYLMTSVYDVLGEALFRCAMKRVKLSPLSEAPEFGYTYKYLLPSDYEMPEGFYNEGGEKVDIDFDVEGRNLLCNEPSIRLRYVAKITKDEIPNLREYVAKCIKLYLAYMLAPLLLSSDSKLGAAKYQEYVVELRKAKSKNAREAAATTLSTDAWTDPLENNGIRQDNNGLL